MVEGEVVYDSISSANGLKAITDEIIHSPNLASVFFFFPFPCLSLVIAKKINKSADGVHYLKVSL